MKTFAVYNLGCRVNAAETNQFAQKLINLGFTPLLSSKSRSDPGGEGKGADLFFINTCSVTKKANIESLGLIRRLQNEFPHSQIIVSGCADLKNLPDSPNLITYNNSQKEAYLSDLHCEYTHKIADKFSHTHRYLLKIQSGCTAFCSYCTVPYRRPYLWSLPIKTAVDTVRKAVADGYKEIIITGVNLNQYTPGLSNLVEALLHQTSIPLISFGSVPLLCIDEKFLKLFSTSDFRLSSFLHIPIQSGSNKILKSMHRPYDSQKILETFSKLKAIPPLSSKRGLGGDLAFGTDIIVGFPGETDADFQKTVSICQKIGFAKIHVFRFSPRPGTAARKLFLKLPPIPAAASVRRSQQIRNLVV